MVQDAMEWRSHGAARSVGASIFNGQIAVKRIIHVDQHAIRHNAKHPESEMRPPISVKTYKGNTKCYAVETTGPVRFVYSADKPLSCGARLWAETDSEVRGFNENWEQVSI